MTNQQISIKTSNSFDLLLHLRETFSKTDYLELFDSKLDQWVELAIESTLKGESTEGFSYTLLTEIVGIDDLAQKYFINALRGYFELPNHIDVWLNQTSSMSHINHTLVKASIFPKLTHPNSLYFLTKYNPPKDYQIPGQLVIHNINDELDL